MAAFSLPDHELIFTKIIVVNDQIIPGPQFRIYTAQKADFDPGGDADFMMGGSNLPVDVVIKTAKPKLEFECGDGEEIARCLGRMGGIGCKISVSLTFVKLDLGGPRAWLFEPTTWKNGGGIALDGSKGWAPTKLELMPTDAQYSANFLPYKSIYAQFTATS